MKAEKRGVYIGEAGLTGSTVGLAPAKRKMRALCPGVHREGADSHPLQYERCSRAYCPFAPGSIWPDVRLGQIL